MIISHRQFSVCRGINTFKENYIKLQSGFHNSEQSEVESQGMVEKTVIALQAARITIATEIGLMTLV